MTAKATASVIQPVPVIPWTWARFLRDKSPASASRDFLFAMLVLRTYMDQNGFAFPTVRTWAKSARMAVNTLRKHAEQARATGWLGVSLKSELHGKNWRGQLYRAAVPREIILSAHTKDEDASHSDRLIAEFGAIEAVSSLVDTASPSRAVSFLADTAPSRVARSSSDAVSKEAGLLCQTEAHAVSKNGLAVSKLCQPSGTKPLNSKETAPEVLEALNSEGSIHEAAPSREAAPRRRTRTTRFLKVEKNPNPPVVEPTIRALLADSELGRESDEVIAKIAKATPEQVKAVRLNQANEMRAKGCAHD